MKYPPEEPVEVTEEEWDRMIDKIEAKADRQVKELEELIDREYQEGMEGLS